MWPKTLSKQVEIPRQTDAADGRKTVTSQCLREIDFEWRLMERGWSWLIAVWDVFNDFDMVSLQIRFTERYGIVLKFLEPRYDNSLYDFANNQFN